MKTTQALFVKFLRMRLECSWRKTWSHYYNRYYLKMPFSNKEFDTNQIMGMSICVEAQKVLNENWEELDSACFP